MVESVLEFSNLAEYLVKVLVVKNFRYLEQKPVINLNKKLIRIS